MPPAASTNTTVDPLFGVVKLNEQGIEAAGEIGLAFQNLVTNIAKIIGPTGMGGREWSNVREHLEVACFYAKKTMTTDTRYHAPAGRGAAAGVT